MSLPLPLQAAVEARHATQGGDRRRGSAALTAVYRAGGSSAEIDLGSYLVTRLPATFASVDRVFAELARLRRGFLPGSLLDAGSGPGTASWAAMRHWPEIQSVTFLDNHPEFLALATELARSGPAQLAGATALRGRIEALPDGLAADLVVAAYALAELPIDIMTAAADRLWQASRQVLVLVEPGTPQGFARLRACRSHLIGRGAIPIAPCTHAMGCPLQGDDWCHFSVRLPRSRAHMHAKAASVPFEDERFAYLVLARDGGRLRRAPGSSRRQIAPSRRSPSVSARRGELRSATLRSATPAPTSKRGNATGAISCAPPYQEENGP